MDREDLEVGLFVLAWVWWFLIGPAIMVGLFGTGLVTMALASCCGLGFVLWIVPGGLIMYTSYKLEKPLD
jgi:hypothetical protein